MFGESALFATGDAQDPSRFRNATVVASDVLEVLVLKADALAKLVASGDLDESTIAALAQVAQQRKCQNTRAALGKILSKKKLYAFMKRADKKQSGWLRRKHVEKLIGGIRVKLMEVVEFDDDVWRSMKSSSSLKKQKNFPKEIEHEAFEEWIFGEKDAAKNNQQNMEEQVESLFH